MTLHGFVANECFMCTNVPKFGLETVIALLLIVFAIALATRSLLQRMLVDIAVLFASRSSEALLCIQTVGS